MKLSGMSTKLHAVGVCDSPEYFYNHIDEMTKELRVQQAVGAARDMITVYPGQGIGYARSTPDELRFIANVAASSGVVLDPVYSGKALFKFAELARTLPDVFKRGQRVLFLHTGGTFGLYDKSDDILPLLDGGLVSKMSVKLPS
jgi:D-cysteine desulfhydrase